MKHHLLGLAAAVTFLASWGPAPAGAQLSTPLDDRLLEEIRWRSIGPANMMGRVTDVEGIPGPSKTFYVASVAGGIWKTTNNGVTFRPLFQEERVVAMGDIAIAPSDTLQIWAGTGEEDSRNSISPGGGIYKSVDGGLTWELKGLEETEVIGRIVVHPTDPDIVWVAALGHIWDHNPERGLYRTTDGGDTWELVKFVSDRAGFVDVAIHPRNPDILFASSWERVRGPYFLESGGPGSALWKTTDGGDTWTEVEGSGFPTTTKGRIGLAISQSDPDVVYAMVEAEEDETEQDDAEEDDVEQDEAEEGTGDDLSGGNGLYRSTDGGTTWEQMNDTNTRPFYYSQVRVDPADPDRVYYSSTPVRVSNDGGRTEGTTTIGVHVDHHALWIDPSDPDRMVAGNDGGIGITFDRGGNWWVPNTIALGQFYHVSYNMDVPYRVCGGLQDNGTWCGPSRVARGDVTNHHWATISGGDGFYSAQDPEDPNLVWAESQGGNMARINMATGERNGLQKPSWEDVWRPRQDSIVVLLGEGVPEDDPRIVGLRERASADSTLYQLRWNWSTPFLQSAHDRSVFYAGANVVLKSTEWGDDLRAVSPDLTYADTMKIRVSTRTTGGITRDVTGAETHATIVALAESPLRQGWLFAGTDDGRVWRTRDDGGEWTELTDRFPGVPEGTWVSRIEPSHHDEDRFYVSFDGHRTNDFTPYVHVTDDGGRTFRSISSDLPTGKPDFVHVVREDPHNPSLLFVGTDVGAYVSTDRGDSWQRFMNGLPTSPVHDLKIHPRDRELIAATHGRSIWIVDIAPLEQLTDRVMAEGAALFDVGPAFQWGGPAVGGESTGQAFFERPTPGTGATIGYYLGDEVAEEIASTGADRGGEGGAMAAPGGRAGGGTAEITVAGSDGEVVATLNGPATAGLHSVSWNLRGPPPPPEPLSPSERRDSIRMAERAVEVGDSLIAEGWEAEPLERMIGLFTGETDRDELFGGGGGRGGGGFGGGGGARDPEAFVERPGESFGGGGRGGGRGGFGGFGGMDVDELREVAELVRPGGGLGGLFGRGGRGGPGAGELVDPGTYTVTLVVGEKSFTKEMRVERMPGLSTDADSPEELEWEAMWRRFLEGEGWD